MNFPKTKQILLMIIFSLYALPVLGMDERNAYEFGDGHWVYFGPAQTSEWTTARRLPLKRSLQQSIRGDALRHYELPRYEMAESGQVISFYGESDPRSGEEAPVIVRGGARSSTESRWEVFELPESGQTIVFEKDDTSAKSDNTVLAQKGEGPS